MCVHKFEVEINMSTIKHIVLCLGLKSCLTSTATTSILINYRTEQNRTEILFVKTCTYIHHHTKHLIQLYTRDIQL